MSGTTLLAHASQRYENNQGLPARYDRLKLSTFIRTLDRTDIEQFAQYEGVCTECGTPFYGILDESLVILPIGGISAFFEKRHGRGLATSTGHVAMVVSYSVYEMRMEIVRSGLYTREQLSKGLFTQHELEVNDRQFKAIRPKRCDCDFGESYVEDPLTGEFTLVGGMTQVDEEMLVSGPVRTGFRRRSPSAIKRRRRSKSPDSTKVLVTNAHTPKEVKAKVHPSLRMEISQPVELRFESRIPLRKRRHRTRAKPRSIVHNEQRGLPPKEKTKYWYFLRKNKRWKYSTHHPLPGDPIAT